MRKGCRRTLAGLLSAALLISQSSAVFAAENTGSVSGAEENATTGITATEEDVDSLEEYGFPGGYELDSEDMELKEELRSKGIADALKESTEGEDYKSGMIWYLAESREEADSIAEAYSAVVTRYDYGVAEAKLTGDRTVLDAVSAAADTDTDLPAVEPVYVCQLEPDAEPEDEDTLDAAGFTLDPSPTWRDFVTGTEEKEAILDKPDTYLTTPSETDYQYQHDLIDSWGAWGTTIGSSGVRVAVVDSGVFAKHEDLQDENGDSIVKKSIDVTGQGRLVTTQHGTHVAGIIAGSINNGKGGAGVAPGVQIYSYNVVHNTAGDFWTPDMTRGILAAVEDNVNIINMSMCSSAYSVYMREALTSAYVHGVISFAAMGNDGTNRIVYPAGYSVESGDKKTGVIAVGATSHSKQRTTYSNYGNWCTVWAPGSQIMSSVPEFDQSKTVDGTNGYGPYFDLKEDVTNAYVSMSGTSMACPVAAGAAALYMSAYGTKLGGGNKELTGSKIPDAMKSVMTGASTTVTGLGKFINVGKMFAREAKAPAIIAYDAEGNVVEKENGKNIYREVSYVMIESQAGLSANTLPRAAENYQKEVIVFTTDGASPAVSKKQLYVVWGKIYKGQKIEVGDLKPGTKTIVRAMAVTPQKEVSAVTNATVYTPVSDPTKVLSEKVNKITLKPNSTLGYAKKPGKTSVMYVGGDDTYAVDTITPTVTLEGSSKTAEDIADKIYWATGNSNVVKILGKNSDGSCNIQALKKGSCNVIMYVYSRGKVKKSKSISVEVKQLVEGIAISGQSVIQPSAKAKTTVKYKAECTPTTANNKKVSWSFSSDSVVLTKTINGSEMTLKETSGNLTLPKGMTIPSDESERTFTLYVRSADGNCMSSVDVTLGNKAEILPTVTVSENTLTDYQLFVENKKSRIEYKTNKNGNSTLSYATVSVVDLQETEGNENTLTLSANMNGTWTSSNANVVGVSAAVNEITDNVTVYGLKAGKAKVTFRSSDGSGKKATFTVYVKTPVSGVATGINIDYSLRTLAVGKSVTPPVYVEKAYGKPSNSSLTWSYEFRPVEYSVDSAEKLNINVGESNAECVALYTATLLDKSVTVNKTTGALKINKSKWNEYHSDYTDKVFVRVKATAADGTDFYDVINYMVTTPVTGVSVNRVENGSFVSMKKNEKMEMPQEKGYYIYVVAEGEGDNNDGIKSGILDIRSSNPKSGSASVAETCKVGVKYYTRVLVLGGKKKGTAEITIKSCDGTGKSFKFKVVTTDDPADDTPEP